MKIENIIHGLQIIDRHRPDGGSPYHVRAEHDEIVAGSLEWNITPEARKELSELGWEENEDYDGWVASV